LVDLAARAWAEDKERSVSGHPDAEELVDYEEGRLGPRGVARLQRHLLVCASCREELLRLHEFDREVPEGSALLPSGEMTELSWQRFQRTREAEEQASTEPPSEEPLEGARPPARPRTGWLLAASIALALAGGVLLGVISAGRVGPSQAASAGSPFVFDLDPSDTTVLRDAIGGLEIVVPPGMDPLVPRLNLGDLTAHEEYVVEVHDGRGHLVLRREGLRRHRSGSVTFLVLRAELSDGDYRVVLIGRDGLQRRQLASYSFRLRFEV
jgi:hypothetical protein